jgi:SOS-response transcriptional repressor LexA
MSVNDQKHFGEFLRKSVERLGIKKKEAADRIGVSDVTLRSWFLKRVPKMRPDNLVNVGRLLGLTVEDLESRMLEAMRSDAKTLKRWKEAEKKMREAGSSINDQIAAWEDLKERGLVEDSVDLNVEPYGEAAVPEVPTFDLPIAAGPWMELPEVDAMSDLAKLKDGRFRVRIRGDSMEKDYPDGSLIEFRCLRPDCGDGNASKLEPGEDYYVQAAESATFKRLKEFDEESLVFVAINKKKYPRPFKVRRADIGRMAKAEYILVKPKGQ